MCTNATQTFSSNSPWHVWPFIDTDIDVHGTLEARMAIKQFVYTWVNRFPKNVEELVGRGCKQKVHMHTV